ncbi:MAG: hypothetical protein CTY19_06785 [Methylomonas sp.]|nr:MAG: hypothetical protein CTY19_06785 [Methylomonas sp.]
MTYLKRFSVLALFSLITTPAWSANVDFCKVKKTYDNSIKIVPPVVTYETCSGKAFYDYAKDFVKAACWEGATDLLEGKCKESESADTSSVTADTASGGTEGTPLDITQ